MDLKYPTVLPPNPQLKVSPLWTTLNPGNSISAMALTRLQSVLGTPYFSGPARFLQGGQHLRSCLRGLPAPPTGRHVGQVEGGGPGHAPEVVCHRSVLPPNHN